MPPRIFTLDEARAALPQVRERTQELVAARADQLATTSRIGELAAVAGSNGHGPRAEELEDLQARRERAERALASALRALSDLGVVVKDVDAGLVDFPSRRDGEDVYLCWQLGEAEIDWWHGIDDGFRGRRRV